MIKIILTSLMLLMLTSCVSSEMITETTTKPTSKSQLISEVEIPLCADAPSGELITCKIARAYCDYKPSVKGSPTFCNDAPYPNHNFTLVVWGEDWSKYDGECLQVTGRIYLYKGKPEIEASSESAVSLCD